MDSDTEGYTCAFCDKAFKRKFDFKRHKKSHINQGRHQCIRCPLTFSRFSDRKKHMQNQHGRVDQENNNNSDLETIHTVLEEFIEDSDTSSRGVTPVLDEPVEPINMETGASCSSAGDENNLYECVSPGNNTSQAASRATAPAAVGVTNPVLSSTTTYTAAQFSIGRLQNEMAVEADCELRIRGPVRLHFSNGGTPTLLVGAVEVIQCSIHKV
jgi:hypothetical protein